MNARQIKALLLAMVMVCACVLTACGGQNNETPENNAEQSAAPGYQVKVVDAFGNPVTSGVIVRFMQGGQQVTMQVVNEEGIAAKELEDGEYTVELQFAGDDEYYYDQTDLTLSAEKTAVEIVLFNALGGEPQNLFAYSLQTDGNKDHNAYHVTVGGTYVELVPGERNYFLFAPTEAGMYEFSVKDSDAIIGYYGAPHFVQSVTTIEPVDNTITESIKASMISTDNTGTTVMVLGLDASENDTSAILTVQRIGDPEWTVEDEPWQVYSPTIELKAYTLPAGASFGEFDLKAASDAYPLVLDAEGYYHLNSADGPLVLVRLGKASGGSNYLTDFQTILEHSGVVKYFYDENGEFVKKESYSECLLKYIEYVDEESGMYPLTEDLKYIIQMRGDHYGWFDAEGNTYLFVDQNGEKIPGINEDISWLFMCCYINN